jgi:uncharacterized protein
MTHEKVSFAFGEGAVSGVWHHPKDRPADCLVVAHGAGGNMNNRFLIAFADRLADLGVGAVRFNFPFSEAGRRSPDPAARAEACYRAVAEQVGTHTKRLFIGGKSFGGRMASHIAADGFSAGGLVFLGYPLHPPGKTERLRDEHLSRIKVPMLFFQGTRDAFARLDLIEATVARLPRAVLRVIDGADHSFKTRVRAPAQVALELAEETAAWISGVDERPD